LNIIHYISGYTHFEKKNPRSHLKILGVTKATQCKFHTEDPQIIVTTAKTISRAIWPSRFLHPCPIFYVTHRSYFISGNFLALKQGTFAKLCLLRSQ